MVIKEESKWYCWKKDLNRNKRKIILALIFLLVAVILDYASGKYTDKNGMAVATDLILDHIPPVNLGFLFVWFYIIVIIAFFLYPLWFKPDKLHYAIGMFSLFVIIRAGFTCLTHLKIPFDAVIFSPPWLIKKIFFTNDLFFSGHTGLPFLGFLIYNKNKFMKYFMLGSSIILAITVLLMHLHYSIDVFAAFFITYGIYKIGNKVFK